MHVHLTHPMLHRLLCGRLRSTLCRKRGALSRPFKPLSPGTGPHDHVPRHIGHGYDRVVERCLNVGDTRLNDLSLLLLSLFHALEFPFMRLVPSWVLPRLPSLVPFEFWHWSWYVVPLPADLYDAGGREN